MIATESVNISSLKIVQDELIATIELSANLIEQFAADRSNADLLQQCVESIKQIRGTFNLIQLKGVDLLAEELVIHINSLTLGDDANTDKKLELISAAFFMLPRYLEYCVQTSRSMAVLLIPHINELRQARRATLLSESYYFDFEPAVIHRSIATKTMPQAEMTVLVRRLRHMYQAGLLKVLQGNQIKSSLNFMCRALERLESICGASAMGNFWWIADATLTAISEQNIAITKNRKFLLSSIDREIKQIELDGAAAFNSPPNETLIKSLLYLLSLSKSTSEKTKAVIVAYDVPLVNYTDSELNREMEYLNGPSATTIHSMVVLLNDELRSSKNILEHSSRGSSELAADTPVLVESLKKIAEILAVVGLVVPSKSLKHEIDKLQYWQSEGNVVTSDDLLSIADTLLYVESTVAGLDRGNMSDEKLTKINALTRDDAMASNQFAEAEKIVIDEAETGVAIVKRALSAFAESNYDPMHISNISATLDGVRGGMFVLGLPRAAKILSACMSFIENSLLENDHPAAIQHMLETFADAIVSLEYYFDGLKVNKNTDTDVLYIAEESLESLGYKVK